MTTYIYKIIGSLIVLFAISACKEKHSTIIDNSLLHVNVYDTLAQISFPNYLSVDTNYTWIDYSDCPCCGELKTRFQNKKDSTYQENGLSNWPPRYKSYVTFILPETIKCFDREFYKKYNFPEREKSISKNMLEQELDRYHTNNIFEIFYYNSKKQGVSISMLCAYGKRRNELNTVIFVTTTNKRNHFPIIIKFEKSSTTSIREFVTNAMKTINEIEVQ